jgi:hypothetical protein
VDAAERKEILSRYVDHSRRFDAVAARRGQGNAEVIPFAAPLRELEQEPTAREVEVLLSCTCSRSRFSTRNNRVEPALASFSSPHFVDIPQQGDARFLWTTEGTKYLPGDDAPGIRSPGSQTKHDLPHVTHSFFWGLTA